MRILLLKDARDLADALVGALRRAGLAVDPVATLAAADEALSVNGYDDRWQPVPARLSLGSA